jgi:hypothetical protein
MAAHLAGDWHASLRDRAIEHGDIDRNAGCPATPPCRRALRRAGNVCLRVQVSQEPYGLRRPGAGTAGGPGAAGKPRIGDDFWAGTAAGPKDHWRGTAPFQWRPAIEAGGVAGPEAAR